MRPLGKGSAVVGRRQNERAKAVITIEFDPLQLSGGQKAWWTKWQKDADLATQQIVEAWEQGAPVQFNDAIWARLKHWLLDNVFHGKCAYCETHLGAARQPGDADHFRPKAGVNFRDPAAGSKTYIVALADDERNNPPSHIQHPGYFWLAYNWKNILPACNYCNRNEGKKSQFPIDGAKHKFIARLSDQDAKRLKAVPLRSPKWESCYYLSPEDLDDCEAPLLLHPYHDQPGLHIGFDEHGDVYPREIGGAPSLKGLHSIRAYDLKTEDLRIGRHEAIQTAEMKFDCAVGYFRKLKGLSEREAVTRAWEEDEIKSIVGGQTKFSAAVFNYLDGRYHRV
jgi:hypothetical protein